MLGIGYNTATNQRGGVTNSGVKLSLFQIDYATKKGDQIDIQELDSITQGGKNSSSEALHNPRLFVMDKQGNVTLPLALTERGNQGQDCNITYGPDGKEQKKDCTPIEEISKLFIGLKTFAVTPEQGIKEKFAKDYLQDFITKKGKADPDAMKKAIQNFPRGNQGLDELSDMRVGYAGDALYTFTPLFLDFIFPNQTNTTLWFE